MLTGSLTRQEDGFFTGVVVDGACVIKTESGEVKLDTLDKFFCPAGLGSYTIEAEQEVHILECFPPAAS